MTPWLVVLAAGLGSYAMRISMVGLAGRREVPRVLELAAPFAMLTAFAALAATAFADQVRSGGGTLAPIGALAAAIVAVRRTGSSHAALLVGMPVLWALTALSH